MLRFAVPFVALFSGACGLSASLELGELNESQIHTLCEEEAQREAVSYDCDGQPFSLSPAPVEECEASFGAVPDACESTVGDVRSCSDAWFGISQEDACNPDFELPADAQAACDALDDCSSE